MLIPLIVLGVALVMMACEAARPGRSWPRVAGWWLRAALLNAAQVGMVFLAGLAWDRWMLGLRPWSADGLGVTGGALVGYLVITFVYYWWHRWRHRPTSSGAGCTRSITARSASRSSPVSTSIPWSCWPTACSPAPSSTCWSVWGRRRPRSPCSSRGLAELFYHWNVPTPYWLGYLVQRPESHCVHHEEGLHAYNYGDLPLVGHAVRHLPQPASLGGPVRLRAGEGARAGSHARAASTSTRSRPRK